MKTLLKKCIELIKKINYNLKRENVTYFGKPTINMPVLTGTTGISSFCVYVKF